MNHNATPKDMFNELEAGGKPVQAASSADHRAEALAIFEGLVADTTADALKTEHLGETVTALNNLPEPIRAVVEPILTEELAEAFVDSITRKLEAGDPLVRTDISRLLNSAKLAALSQASYLSGMPWHLATRSPELTERISKALWEGIDLHGVHKIFADSGAVNLFIAAREADDPTSYLRAAKALLDRLPAAHVVLDAEMITFWNGGDVGARTALGLRGCNIDVSTRAECAQHSGMSVRGMRAIFVDTSGKQFNPRSSVQPANDDATPEVAASVPSPQASDRLSAIRARQARAAAPRRA